MENTRQDILRLQAEFRQCRKLFTALGDETRQLLLCKMLEGPCSGSRVTDISEKTHLSRPAVSHHMQILKDAGIVRSRKEGTRIYYYLNPQDSEMGTIMQLFTDIQHIMENVPNRSDETEFNFGG